MSRRECQTINRRLLRGRDSSTLEGKYISRIAPYGYRHVKLPDEKGYTLESEPEEAKNMSRRYSKGNYVFDAVPTTDWGRPETLDRCREDSALVNQNLDEKGLDCRIDHRSCAEQAVDLLPTVYEGVAVQQMEQRGIRTEKGDLNRWINASNRILQALKKRLASLKQ